MKSSGGGGGGAKSHGMKRLQYLVCVCVGGGGGGGGGKSHGMKRLQYLVTGVFSLLRYQNKSLFTEDIRAPDKRGY